MASNAGIRTDALRPHHSSKAAALHASPPEMQPIDSVDSAKSMLEPGAARLESSSTQPSACSTAPAWANRAARLTLPITDTNARAIVSMLKVIATRIEATSKGITGGRRPKKVGTATWRSMAVWKQYNLLFVACYQ